MLWGGILHNIPLNHNTRGNTPTTNKISLRSRLHRNTWTKARNREKDPRQMHPLAPAVGINPATDAELVGLQGGLLLLVVAQHPIPRGCLVAGMCGIIRMPGDLPRAGKFCKETLFGLHIIFS
jgi:hypothetical protein